MATLAQVIDIYRSCDSLLGPSGASPGVPFCAGRSGGAVSLGWRFTRPHAVVSSAMCDALQQEMGHCIEKVQSLPGRLELTPRRSWTVEAGKSVRLGPAVVEPYALTMEDWEVLRRRALLDAGVPSLFECGPVSAPTVQAQDTLLTRLTLLCTPPAKTVKLDAQWSARSASSRSFGVLLAFSQAVKGASRGHSEETDSHIHCESMDINALRVFVSTARSLSVGDPSFCVRSMMDFAREYLSHVDRSSGLNHRVAGTLYEASKAINLALPQHV